jgi:ankyrin repeat protein
VTERKLWIDNSCWNEGNPSWKLKDSKQIRAELAKGADPNEANALHEAIREGATQSVYALVKHGADIHGRDWHGTSTLQAVSEFVRWSTSDEEKEKKALTIAAYLIKNGADPKAQDQHGRTVLHNTKNERLIELFIQKGADPAAKNSSGETPYQHQHKRLEREADPAQVARLSPTLKAAHEKALIQETIGELKTAWKPSNCKADHGSVDHEAPMQKQRRVM